MNRTSSRTTNALLSFISSVGGQLITILANFATRTVFIAVLGKTYLGISGLFSNILTALSLAELGVGTAIIYKLYEPIAGNDHRRIAIIMRFYRSACRLVGAAILGIGLCLIPFLPKLINGYDQLASININAVFIFCLFLLKSVSSYLFYAYRSALIKADQKEYLINLVGYFFTLGTAVLQIICLYLFGSFYLHVFLSILQVIGQNVACAILSGRRYPFMKEKPEGRLEPTEIRAILKDCRALFLYKMNGVVLKATDNIVISMFIGLEAVGEYANYYIVYLAIKSLLGKIYNPIAHSLGNLHTEKNRGHEYRIFEAVILITAILGGTAFVGVFICADEFILSWIGREWLIAPPFSFLMGLEIYTLAFRIALSKYRLAMGLFQQAKYRPLAGMIINLVVSVALVRRWGICGVLGGTIIADWTTMMWFDPIIIHRYGFENTVPVKVYFSKYLKYFFTVCAVGAADYWICANHFAGKGWLSFAAHGLICGLTVPGVLILMNFKTDEGRYVYGLCRRYYAKIKGRKK